MTKRILYTGALLLLTLILIVSCGKKEGEKTSAANDTMPTLDDQAQRSVPRPPDTAVVANAVKIRGREVAVEVNLWYNLMPGPEKTEPPTLNTQVRMMTEEKTTLPADVWADYVWITLGGGTWGVASEEESMGSGSLVERMFRGGPYLDEEADSLPSATVIVQISDKDGNHFYVRKSDQKVEKVY